MLLQLRVLKFFKKKILSVTNDISVETNTEDGGERVDKTVR